MREILIMDMPDLIDSDTDYLLFPCGVIAYPRVQVRTTKIGRPIFIEKHERRLHDMISACSAPRQLWAFTSASSDACTYQYLVLSGQYQFVLALMFLLVVMLECVLISLFISVLMFYFCSSLNYAFVNYWRSSWLGTMTNIRMYGQRC
ncbi:hypothetical protein F5B21DRAFT_479442 [Xylaria acuta]|nr:hypothetical protein F5B21DRAFT_479442 [Xylaria acuta]